MITIFVINLQISHSLNNSFTVLVPISFKLVIYLIFRFSIINSQEIVQHYLLINYLLRLALNCSTHYCFVIINPFIPIFTSSSFITIPDITISTLQ